MSGENVLVIDDSPTILKVVQLALTRAGFRVHAAPGGQEGIALARESRPDVILLDFVMPNMNGYQVCRELAEDEHLAEIPIVLMSAKGEEIGERFVKIKSVVDYVTKPFSPDVILAVVSHTIEKRAREDDPPSVLPAPVEPSGATAAGAAAASTDDSQALRPPAPALTGNLALVSLSEVLTLLGDQFQTGVLTALQGDSRVTVSLREGRIDLATARGVPEEFLLGRFAVEAGHLTTDELAAILDARTRSETPPGLLGADLVRRGLMTDAALKQVMSRQTSELVYEILRWSAGTFTFEATAVLPDGARESRLGIAVDNLLMEGFRRVDEWRLIEREIESFDLIFLRNEDRIAELGRGKLTRDEIAVLDLVSGKSSVKDLIRASRMGSFDVTKMLYRLLRIKLIRRRVMPMAV